MRSRLFPLALTTLAPGVAACASHEHARADHDHRHGMVHRFDDAAGWAKQFDAPERDAWQKPDDVVKALAPADNAVVVDLGAGTGYFAVRLARAVHNGRVIGVDVEEGMVRYLDERAAKEGLSNLKGHLTPTDRADFGEAGPVDLVLVVNTYHHIGNRVAYFAAVKEKLSPGGRLAIVDFRPESERGPPKELKLSDTAVVEELAAAGFVLATRHDFLPDQYVLEFTARQST